LYLKCLTTETEIVAIVTEEAEEETEEETEIDPTPADSTLVRALEVNGIKRETN
jgi:hypothetical protein